DLSGATAELPRVDRMVIDNAGLDRGLDGLPSLMEDAVRALAEHMDEGTLPPEAPAWSAAFAGAFAREMGLDDGAAEAGRTDAVVMPRIVDAGPPGDPPTTDEVRD